MKRLLAVVLCLFGLTAGTVQPATPLAEVSDGFPRSNVIAGVDNLIVQFDWNQNSSAATYFDATLTWVDINTGATDSVQLLGKNCVSIYWNTTQMNTPLLYGEYMMYLSVTFHHYDGADLKTDAAYMFGMWDIVVNADGVSISQIDICE